MVWAMMGGLPTAACGLGRVRVGSLALVQVLQLAELSRSWAREYGRRLWGPGLGPEPPGAPGSVSLGTGYRSAPSPGGRALWGGEPRGFSGRIRKTDLTRKPPHPCTILGSEEFSLEGPCAKQARALGRGLQGLARQWDASGECPGPSWTPAPAHRALAFHPLPLHPLHLPLPG